jgi:hypothetical protein
MLHLQLHNACVLTVAAVSLLARNSSSLRYSTNSEDNFPNVEKNAEKSISYVRMGAEQPWNRCFVALPTVFTLYLTQFLQ